MDEIQTLLSLDWFALIFGVFVVMSGVIAAVTIIGKFSELIKKPVWWIRNKQKDHELIIENAKAIQELAKRHEEDTRQSIKHDKIIQDDLSKLTHMMLDKQINDYRWEIINLADKISSGKQVSKECFKHAIATYEKYEKLIEENGLVNGEVEISIEVIRENYQEKMKNGNF